MSDETNPNPNPPVASPGLAVSPEQKAGILLAVSQMDMFLKAFNSQPGGVPEAVGAKALEFRQTLQDWADGKL